MPQILQSDVQRYQRAMAQAERPADTSLSQLAEVSRQPLQSLRAAAGADRAAEKASQARLHYAQHRLQETDRTKRYKAANPTRKKAMDAVRNARITAQADGSASSVAIRKLKEAATHCAYCNSRLFSKQTDHLNPLVLGGEHSMRNIAIVCPGCNETKHALSYTRWIERVDPHHRARVVALFASRYGLQHAISVAA